MPTRVQKRPSHPTDLRNLRELLGINGSMATEWWSMKPNEETIAKRDDKDYVDDNGSLKSFSRDVWIASCKWQRRMRDRRERKLLELGESMGVSQSSEPPSQMSIDDTLLYTDDQDQGIGSALGHVDDRDDQDEYGGSDDIVSMVSQKIQEKYEGMQKQLDEKDELHEEEKERMREVHEQEMERQRQALGKYTVIFSFSYIYSRQLYWSVRILC